MIAIVLVGAVAGAVCGLARLNIWAVISVTVLFLIITVINGSVTDLGIGTIGLTFLIGTTLLQLFYLVGSLLSQERTLPVSSRPELVRLVQSAIGQEMRMTLALPVELPPQLEVRLAQLEVRYG